MAMGQYWLGKTNSFQIDPKHFQNFKENLFNEIFYWLTN